MKKSTVMLRNIFISSMILCVCFTLCIIIYKSFKNENLIPAMLVFSAFIAAVTTECIIYSTVISFVNVLVYNCILYFLKIDFNVSENIIPSAIILIISVIICFLTARIMRWKKMKDEIYKECMKAYLIRAVSHDLRTPLTTLCGSSYVMLKNNDVLTEDKKLKMLNGMYNAAQQLSNLLDNLSSVLKLDGADSKLIKTPTALDELIDSVLIKFGTHFPDQKVLVDIPEDFMSIPMDAVLIKKVLLNLLENAVLHAKGMKRLSLKVFEQSGKAVFEISDDGCGIAADKLKNLFTCYCGVKPSDFKDGKAGIGLFVCLAILKAHGGYIEAENAKSGGTVFRFTLDMESPTDE